MLDSPSDGADALPATGFVPSERGRFRGHGEVSEWLKELAWKAGIRFVAVSWVRIPPSPPETQEAPIEGFSVGASVGRNRPSCSHSVANRQFTGPLPFSNTANGTAASRLLSWKTCVYWR